MVKSGKLKKRGQKWRRKHDINSTGVKKRMIKKKQNDRGAGLTRRSGGVAEGGSARCGGVPRRRGGGVWKLGRIVKKRVDVGDVLCKRLWMQRNEGSFVKNCLFLCGRK